MCLALYIQGSWAGLSGETIVGTDGLVCRQGEYCDEYWYADQPKVATATAV